MDQILAKIFRYIPEWLFVLIIMAAGLGYFFYDKPLVSVCDAQIADFANGQNGKLFPRIVKVVNPLTGSAYSDNIIRRSREMCIESIDGMGCYSYFKIIKGILFDFKKLDQKCLLELSKKPLIVGVFDQYLETMTRLAWGETPPKSEVEKRGQLSDIDVQTFCSMRSYYRIFYDSIKWDGLVKKTLTQLVEDPNSLVEKIDNGNGNSKIEEFQESIESEKEYKFQKAKMSLKRAFDLSLLSLDCLYYQ